MTETTWEFYSVLTAPFFRTNHSIKKHVHLWKVLQREGDPISFTDLTVLGLALATSELGLEIMGDLPQPAKRFSPGIDCCHKLLTGDRLCELALLNFSILSPFPLSVPSSTQPSVSIQHSQPILRCELRPATTPDYPNHQTTFFYLIPTGKHLLNNPELKQRRLRR